MKIIKDWSKGSDTHPEPMDRRHVRYRVVEKYIWFPKNERIHGSRGFYVTKWLCKAILLQAQEAHFTFRQKVSSKSGYYWKKSIEDEE